MIIQRKISSSWLSIISSEALFIEIHSPNYGDVLLFTKSEEYLAQLLFSS
jgi:hypothetical protein